MSNSHEEVITIIYYCDSSLKLKHHICAVKKSKSGRVIIPDEFKQDKTIVAVCNGEVDIMNKVGERILPSESIQEL